MKRIIIIGASSGLGYGITEDFAQMGWKVGIAARREEPLKELCQKYPDNICYETIDVTADDAAEKMLSLISRNGGMDTLLLASGIGKQNPDLQNDIDTRTTLTNVVGFTRIVDAAFNYFKTEKKEFPFKNEDGYKEIPFGMCENVFGKFPQKGYADQIGTVPSDKLYACAASGAWAREDQLIIKVQIIDDYFGNLNITAGFREDDKLGIFMKKTAEDFLQQYDGFAGGTAIY
jgi:NAD(P)-dependent dehydrogenase (short-subunit alcohol dehydrogenase family)